MLQENRNSIRELWAEAYDKEFHWQEIIQL
jgi:hypothetical protein